MVVERVSSALQHSSHGFSESDQVMSDYQDSEGAASKEEETMELMEPEDTMTLVQYQSKHRKEVLSRKIVQSLMPSHKKGRVVTEGEVP